MLMGSMLANPYRQAQIENPPSNGSLLLQIVLSLSFRQYYVGRRCEFDVRSHVRFVPLDESLRTALLDSRQYPTLEGVFFGAECFREFVVLRQVVEKRGRDFKDFCKDFSNVQLVYQCRVPYAVEDPFHVQKYCDCLVIVVQSLMLVTCWHFWFIDASEFLKMKFSLKLCRGKSIIFFHYIWF